MFTVLLGAGMKRALREIMGIPTKDLYESSDDEEYDAEDEEMSEHYSSLVESLLPTEDSSRVVQGKDFFRTHIAPGERDIFMDVKDTPMRGARAAHRRLENAVVSSRLDVKTLDLAESENNEVYTIHVYNQEKPDKIERSVSYRIVNILYTYTMYDKNTGVPVTIPIKQMAIRYASLGFRFSPSHFGKTSVKTSSPNSYISFYTSGKVKITGIRGEKIADELSAKLVLKGLIHGMGFTNVEFRNQRRHNVVGSFQVPYTFSLNLMCRSYVKNINHAPSRFNAIVFRNLYASGKNKKCTILFFTPNKGICIGAGSVEILREAIKRADEVAYPMRYELSANRGSEDVLSAEKKEYNRSTKHMGEKKQRTQSNQ
jgi:TATA-box binding protein (TBP) (component of TFIID and TFIIIB)